MLIPALLLALLLALAAVLLWARRARAAARATAAAAGRRHVAGLELDAARADFDTTSAKLAAVVAVDAMTRGRGTGGFGDAHVRRARLRAALAVTADTDGPQL